MHNRIILKYILDVNVFNLGFSALVWLIGDFKWALLSFSTFGVIFGLFGFQAFRRNEYFGYYNLGFTRSFLLTRLLLFNWSVSLLPALILLIFR